MTLRRQALAARLHRRIGKQLEAMTDEAMKCEGRGWTMLRRPNFGFRCARCGAVREIYLRPSYEPPAFCSRSCAVSARLSKPTERAKHARVGSDHYAWQGDRVSVRGGRARAIRTYQEIGPCTECGALPAERHHIDGNTANNDAENIGVLCRRCHMSIDGRLEQARENLRRVQPLGVAARWRSS